MDRDSQRATERAITIIADKLAEGPRMLAGAAAGDKSEIFRQLGLKLTFHPGRRIVEASIQLVPQGSSTVSELDRAENPQFLATEFPVGRGRA